MSHTEEQLVGILFRALSDGGHPEASQQLLDAYRDGAATDRADLAENLFSQLFVVLDNQLGTAEEIDVLTTAVRSLVDRLSAIIEATPVAILVVDADGTVQLWNEGASDIFGWQEAEMRGRSYPATLPESPDGFESALERLRDGERIHGMETRHRHRDGSMLDVRLWAAPLESGSGNLTGATLVISDITEQKQREQRLSVLNRVLRHNIRNDVTVARNHLELLSQQLSADNRHAEIVDERLSNITQLSEDARRIERLERDEGPDRQPVDIAEMLRERLDRLRDIHPTATVEISAVETDRVLAHDLFPYALDNVLENAIEHNDSDTPRVEVGVIETDPERAVLTVADNGPGMPDSERAVLASEEETPLAHSSGLGLWLTRWIIRRSNGTVDVESSRFGGTRISFVLREADPI